MICAYKHIGPFQKVSDEAVVHPECSNFTKHLESISKQSA